LFLEHQISMSPVRVPGITIRGHSNRDNHHTSTNYISHNPLPRLISHDQIHLYVFTLFNSPHKPGFHIHSLQRLVCCLQCTSELFPLFSMFLDFDICLYPGFPVPVSTSGFVCLIGLIYCALTSCLFSTFDCRLPFQYNCIWILNHLVSEQ